MKGFKGVDFANSVAQVSPSRSPNAENIVSDLAGKPVKRPGWQTLIDFVGRINGVHRLKTIEKERILVHSGTFLYELEYDKENDLFSEIGIVSQSMNDERSMAFQMNECMYILDGKTYQVYGPKSDGTGYEIATVESKARVPRVVISLNPDGTGGSMLEDTNVLTPRRMYSFFGTAEATEYHISSDDSVQLMDTGDVIVEVMNENAEWDKLTSGTDYTVNRQTGVITFTAAPGESPGFAGGIDNIRITVPVKEDLSQKAQESDETQLIKVTADLINKCTFAVVYGSNASSDRLFISGNPAVPNFMYWSDINDPTYFPGRNYMFLGDESSAIMGFSIINESLIVHKDDTGNDDTTFMISGSYDDSSKREVFAVRGQINGVGAVSRYCFSRLDTEPLFLSKQGVHAITTQYLTAERYAQVRSWYVNPRLINEDDLANAISIEYNNYYFLAVNGRVYVADGRQKTYEQNAPQSTFQYEWYYLVNVPARVWWEYEDHLYFGTDDGRLCRFSKHKEDSAENPIYNDDGQAIRAFWDTPFFTYGQLGRYKTLKGFWVMTAPYRRSSVDIFYRYRGNFIKTKESTNTLDIFDFNDIDFTRFTFVTDDSPYVVATNRKAKKFITIQYRVENTGLNEGFGFYEFEASYIINGKNKG